MNIERLITMFFRLFARKIVSRGIDAGIGLATRGRGDKSKTPAEDAARSKGAKDMAKKARQGAKIIRRMGRM